MHKELIILVGNVASGKSTTCKEYQKKGYIVISKDSLRYAIGMGNYVFKKKYEHIIFETELGLLANFLELGVPIVVDGTALNKNSRARYIFLAQNYGYKIISHVMPKLNMKESVDRRMKDPHGNFRRKTWEKIWTQFNKNYKEPSLKEGFDEIITEKK